MILAEKDKQTLSLIAEDIDANLFPKESDDKVSLSQRISKSTYLDGIVIYYPSHSVLNDSLNSHQPKRRSEGVVMGSLHTYNGSDGEGRGKKIIQLPNYTSFGRHQDNWHGRPMKENNLSG